ncbi:MAG: hypothetical protein AB1896_22715, partial [Thermodesulfobacteriota bacterium]
MTGQDFKSRFPALFELHGRVEGEPTLKPEGPAIKPEPEAEGEPVKLSRKRRLYLEAGVWRASG